jgi:hypothetical protein
MPEESSLRAKEIPAMFLRNQYLGNVRLYTSVQNYKIVFEVGRFGQACSEIIWDSYERSSAAIEMICCQQANAAH